MRTTFPQELVDKVIDELVVLHSWQADFIAPYSLVSRSWVSHTRSYCFRRIYFSGLDDLKKWSERITPDPVGVSQYTRQLVLTEVDTLEGFEEHMRAFTRVNTVEIIRCGLLLSPSVAEWFAPISSNLTQLDIGGSETTSRIITSLLARLPQLKSLVTWNFRVTEDAGAANPVSRIPFFEGDNSLVLHGYCGRHGLLGPPDWIPPSARFGGLEINTTYFLSKGVAVNQWLSGSCTTLVSLSIDVHPDVLLPSKFTPLDLSSCRVLERLFITTPIHRPGIVAETVLPSITSPRLSFICLQSEATSNKGHSEFDYPAWAVVVDHLRRLCKRFEARNPGKQMKVGISGDWGLIQPQTSDPPEYPIWKRVFFGLSEEAAVRFLGPILYILVEKSDLRMINLTQWKSITGI